MATNSSASIIALQRHILRLELAGDIEGAMALRQGLVRKQIKRRYAPNLVSRVVNKDVVFHQLKD